MELSDLACEYFEERMQKIHLINASNGEVNGFFGQHLNPRGRDCYFLTVLALLGLRNEDRRFCGMIDPMPRSGYQTVKDYLHAWVEYRFEDEIFVYDPLVGCSIPQDDYYNICKPRKVSSKRTLVEMLKPYIISRYIYRLSKNTWVFKAREEAFDEVLEESVKYVFSALQLGYLVGDFDGSECKVSMFIANDPRV